METEMEMEMEEQGRLRCCCGVWGSEWLLVL